MRSWKYLAKELETFTRSWKSDNFVRLSQSKWALDVLCSMLVNDRHPYCIVEDIVFRATGGD